MTLSVTLFSTYWIATTGVQPVRFSESLADLSSSFAHTRFYHRVDVVWVTKYRYKVFQGAIRARIRAIIIQTCNEMGGPIVKGVLACDHGHMVINVPPQLALASVMLRINGRSSRRLQMAFPELRKRYWRRRFWARGYFSTTSGNVTDDIILQYLELHSKRDATGVRR